MGWLGDQVAQAKGLFGSSTADSDPPAGPPSDPPPAAAAGPPQDAITRADMEAAGITEPRLSQYLDPLNAAMIEFDIHTPVREAMFLATVAWESDDFKQLDETWGPTPYQLKYPYGQTYKGRGLIQLTGLQNYTACAKYFGLPISAMSTWLQCTEGACRSAAWWWSTNGLNALADTGRMDVVRRRVNGPAMLGLKQCTEIYQAIARVKGIL